ncbi:uncharacterized protein BCR38DRAFT_41233 [Pseudomassariella vexata]|uniref:Secreted protein n=1 Tax=Pseudomassariella vexata TaxID=1141098 RepID=A0A1Y2DMT4_9PEZI|nr:uncharacterized protein BCR38DRAFT_41233 [Pseudomassariella vexata]ORY60557.1 hypothetical protein BCR38DRAFT_41233 [Pseudomassariella vexata]
MAGRGVHSSSLISALSIFLRLDSLLIASRGSLLDSGCLLPYVCVPPTSANILDSGSLSATKRFPIRCKRLQRLSFATSGSLAATNGLPAPHSPQTASFLVEAGPPRMTLVALTAGPRRGLQYTSPVVGHTRTIVTG